MPSVSLALGSGGARGLAHIGVIRYLEEHGYKISAISGTSIGALIGGIYAAGALDDFEKWVRAIKRSDIVSLLDLSWSKDGLFRGEEIINTLTKIVGEQSIENLPIPFTAIAAHIKAHEEVRIQSGSLFEAIRASISLPVFFTPQTIDGKPLVDGGILNPLPIDVLQAYHHDLTIAVNLCATPNFDINLDDYLVADEPNPETRNAITQNIKSFIQNINQSLKSINRVSWGAYDVTNQTIDTMQHRFGALSLAQYPPDYCIDIPSNICQLLDFDQADPLINYGYHAAEQMIKAQTS